MFFVQWKRDDLKNNFNNTTTRFLHVLIIEKRHETKNKQIKKSSLAVKTKQTIKNASHLLIVSVELIIHISHR